MVKRLVIVASLSAAVIVPVTAVASAHQWLRPIAHTVSSQSTAAPSQKGEGVAATPAEVSTRRPLTVGTVIRPTDAAPFDLQGQLDAARNRGGGIVGIPVGNWKLSTTINVWGGTAVRGAGAQSCLVMSESAVDLLNIAGPNVSLEDFCLVGPGGVASHGGNGPGRGVVNANKGQSLRAVTIRNLRISFTQGHAIELYGSPSAHLSGIIIDNNLVTKAGGHGVVAGFIDGGRVSSNVIVQSAIGGLLYGDGAINIEGSSALSIDNNLVDGSMYSGIQANTLIGSVVQSNTVTNTKGSGFAFWNCTGDTFTNNTSSGNSDQGFYWAFNSGLPGAPRDNLIQGNLARANGKNGFQLVQQTSVRFIGNTASDNNAEDGPQWSGLMVQQHSSGIQVSSNLFENTRTGHGQMFGVAAPDTTTTGLSVSADNQYVRMRQQDLRI